MRNGSGCTRSGFLTLTSCRKDRYYLLNTGLCTRWEGMDTNSTFHKKTLFEKIYITLSIKWMIHLCMSYTHMVIFERELKHKHWIQRAVLREVRELLINLPQVFNCSSLSLSPWFNTLNVKLEGLESNIQTKLIMCDKLFSTGYLNDIEKMLIAWSIHFLKANKLKISKEKVVWEPSSPLPLQIIIKYTGQHYTIIFIITI